MKKKIPSILLVLSLFSFAFSQEKRREINWLSQKEKSRVAGIKTSKVNPNTANYDVTYHKIELNVDPAVRNISGKVTTNYTALTDMNTITFDLVKQMVVSSVKQNNANLSFTQNNNNELVITLPTTQLLGSSASVEVTYAGVPPNTGHVFFKTHNGSPVFFTLSESFGDREWWPCKQDMRDKIDKVDLYITAPSKYVSVGNGVEVTAPVVSGSNKTTHFQHNYPIPAYLVSVAVANYSVFNQQGGTTPNTYPIINYVFPENLSLAQQNLAEVPSFLTFYESLLGTYPYQKEKYGNAEVTESGMEHPTVSFISDYDRYMMEHEMAHQWFGDKITCATWNEIWLNEGFATFMDQLLIEHFDGNSAGISNRNLMINYVSSLPGGAVYLTDTEALDENRIFDARLTYYKGAMVLNMLRLKVGESVFLQGLNNYINDPKLIYKTAITKDFITHMEAVYGSSLVEFFNDWIYNQGYPIYQIKVQNLAQNQVKVTVGQTQSHNSVKFFKMPLPIRFTGSGGKVYNMTLDNTKNNEEFIINVPFAITGASFDPEKHIVSRNSVLTLSLAVSDVEKKKVAVYPNPVRNILTIQNVESSDNITITNAVGQKIPAVLINKNQIDFSKLNSGIYFLQIETKNGKEKFTIVKK